MQTVVLAYSFPPWRMMATLVGAFIHVAVTPSVLIVRQRTGIDGRAAVASANTSSGLCHAAGTSRQAAAATNSSLLLICVIEAPLQGRKIDFFYAKFLILSRSQNAVNRQAR